MTRLTIALLLSIFIAQKSEAQNIIPFDTAHWEIKAKAYIQENYKGKDAIYLHQGLATLKDTKFINGSIEFDIYLTKRQSFPGVYFRSIDKNNSESFYLRPHQSGNPDANQAAPVMNGISPWQLYFGPAYSFVYNYKFDDWTHVKLVINDRQGQVFMDYSEKPHLSWHLKHSPREGEVAISSNYAPMHYANFKINQGKFEMVDFKVKEVDIIEGIIEEWEVSDKFDESLLKDPAKLQSVINARKWNKKIRVEENSAANISREVSHYGSDENTVFTRITINSSSNQVKLFEFGYSDRVIAILNGKPIYKGNNGWRTRDYRYLGTIGLFDGIYLNLKRGKNTLLMAVSEDFGGWGVTGKFESTEGIEIK